MEDSTSVPIGSPVGQNEQERSGVHHTLTIWSVTATNDKDPSSRQRGRPHIDKPVTFQKHLKSDHDPQMELHTKN
jgi:hypothetical protein